MINLQDIRDTARDLLAKGEARAVVGFRRGSRGMALFEREGPVTFMPIHGGDEIADVTGAGDTVISTFTVALAAGTSGVQKVICEIVVLKD